jgi:hypothetical protein
MKEVYLLIPLLISPNSRIVVLSLVRNQILKKL